MENETPVDPTTEEPTGTPQVEDGQQNTQAEEDSTDGDGDKKPAKERSPEEVERIRLNRKIERLVQQRGELRAKLESYAQRFTESESRATNPPSQSDNEALQLTRADLQKLVEQEARKLAPSIKAQEAEFEKRGAVVQRLAKEWGTEKFDAYSADLEDAFGGLVEGNKPKPAVDAIFESDDPKALIEYLADPVHADEAESLSRMSAIAAARAITKLEVKLAAEKAKAKPQPSKAAAPIEPIKGQGKASEGYRPDMSDAEFARWRRKSIAQRR